MRTGLRLTSAIIATLMSGAALSAQIDALSLSSDAWLRAGPSTSDRRIVGLPRGTAVIEIADPETVLKPRARRWVRVYVLEGKAADRQGWVWGRFIRCCEEHEWLE